jgi:type VI secretion system lysozyme-like protein
MLLFERLIDFTPLDSDEALSDLSAGPADDAASIRREIARLIQTRRPIGVDQALHALPTSVRDYGIPDASTLSPRSVADCAAFARTIRDAIISYEPRLEQPFVEVRQSQGSVAGMCVVVTGHIRGHADGRRTSFPVPLQEG